MGILKSQAGSGSGDDLATVLGNGNITNGIPLQLDDNNEIYLNNALGNAQLGSDVNNGLFANDKLAVISANFNDRTFSNSVGNPTGNWNTALLNTAINISWADASALAGDSLLITGQTYLINNATPNAIFLLVVANSTSTFSISACDVTSGLTAEYDIINYSFFDDVIFWRWDTLNNISSFEDWRNGTPNCIIGAGVANIILGYGANGTIPDNSSDVKCEVGCSFLLQNSASLLANVTLGNNCSIVDNNIRTTITDCNIQNGSSLSNDGAVLITFEGITLGISSVVSTQRAVVGATILNGCVITFDSTSTDSVNFSIGEGSVVNCASLNNATIGDNVTISTLQDIATGVIEIGFSTLPFDYDVDNISSNTIDLTFGGTDDVSWAGIINLVLGTGGTKVINTITGLNREDNRKTSFFMNADVNVSFQITSYATASTNKLLADSLSSIAFANKGQNIGIIVIDTDSASHVPYITEVNIPA